MGASFSTWARWDDTVVQRTGNALVQNPGPSMFQGAKGLTINGGVFSVIGNQEVTLLADEGRLCRILDFLSLVNFRSIQSENLGKWTPGTVKWLLESSMFQFWLETQLAILWGTGMPGAGKTILASVVIDYLEKLAKESSDVCLAFVYCRYTEPMSVRDILAALVRQLVEQYPHILPGVEPLYTKHSLRKTKPTQQELLDVIRGICGTFRIAYFFIDGLDEALYDEQFDLLDTLKSIKANFFITSRPLIRLKDVLPNAEFFDIAAQNEDIKLLVAHQIDRSPDLRQVLVTEEAREQVIDKICESSCGMFLHASLMVEVVRHCTNVGSILSHLDKLPPKLDVLYDEAFKRIEMQSEERATLAKRVLTWVVFAFQALTVEDVQYAVVNDPNRDWDDPQHLVPESLLISVCCGLVVIERRTGKSDEIYHVVRLVHYTAHSALKRLLGRAEMSPHGSLAETCVERLMHCGITDSESSDPRELRNALLDPQFEAIPRPLLKYAYGSWYLHARESIPNPAHPGAQPVPAILRFLSKCVSFPAVGSLPSSCIFDLGMFTSPIHLLAFYSLPSLLSVINTPVNAVTRKGISALSLAAWRGDTETIEALLSLDGFEMTHQDQEGGYTALAAAAMMGNADMVAFLLRDPRIDVRKRWDHGGTALHAALEDDLLQPRSSGHIQAALHLIAAPGVDINAVNDNGCTPLMLACSHSLELMDSLLQHPDIDLYLRDNDGRTPLMHACESGESAAVQRYLRLPNATAKDHSGATALTYRARYRFRGPSLDEVNDFLSDFRALIGVGLSINDKDAKGLTALAHAARNGHQKAIEALVQLEGVDTNVRDNEGRTLAMIACDPEVGHDPGVLTLLLDLPGAEINARDSEGRPAIMYAAKYRGEPEDLIDLFSVFLEHPGLDVNARDTHGMSALTYAVVRAVRSAAAYTLMDFSSITSAVSEEHYYQDGRRRITIFPSESSERTQPFQLVEVRELTTQLLLEEGSSRQHFEIAFNNDPLNSESGGTVCSHGFPPSPWKFVTPADRYVDDRDLKKIYERLEQCGLAFPWKQAWISRRFVEGPIQQLLNHPGIDDCGLGYLRNALVDGGTSSSE